jgi:hypothetical protein
MGSDAAGYRDCVAWAHGIGIAIMWPSRERLDTRHERGSQARRDSSACDDNARKDNACKDGASKDSASKDSGSANSASDNSANPPASSLTQP